MEFAEVWKDIPNSNYQISNKGRMCNCSRISKPVINSSGYLRICFRKHGGRLQTESIHRLVALNFVPNPLKLPQINHKDENKLNNFYDNLEWCTQKYNTNYGTSTKRRVEKLNMSVLNVTTGEIFASAKEASGKLNINRNVIGAVCRGDMYRRSTGSYGKYKTAGGYEWQYHK